jgi:DNA polymerase I-like protein with 3'-5' exonuclease and polymerase domains
MCKKLGHGTNYGGHPNTMSAQTKTDLHIIVDFQGKYFKAFPAHEMWHANVKERIRSYGYLISLMGRKRCFFGRRDSDDTIRDAIAYDPQGSLADIVNQGMLRVWAAGDCQLLMQNHDSILIQYPEEIEDEIIPKIQQQLHHEIQLKYDRILTIPYGCQVGWNWGKYSEGNVDGLKTYQPGDKRTRQKSV